MEIRFIAYALAGTLFIGIKDAFDIGDGFYVFTALCYWRMLVEYGRIYRADRENRDQ
jgi:hypothetical protein